MTVAWGSAGSVWAMGAPVLCKTRKRLEDKADADQNCKHGPRLPLRSLLVRAAARAPSCWSARAIAMQTRA